MSSCPELDEGRLSKRVLEALPQERFSPRATKDVSKGEECVEGGLSAQGYQDHYYFGLFLVFLK